MEIGREDRERMERAHVLAWPALRTADVSGWLWRSSGGGSQRANSVSTIEFHGADVEAAVDEVESRYRALGKASRFHTFDETSPPGLTDLLRRRGYTQTEPTITMFKRVGRPDGLLEVESGVDPWNAWLDVYLNEITWDRRAVNGLIIERIPPPRAFFGGRRGGGIVSTALSVAGFGCAVIECVTTQPAWRRQGAARMVLAAQEAWAAQQGAEWIGLQVVPTNIVAVTCYEQIGFTMGAANQFWVSYRTGG